MKINILDIPINQLLSSRQKIIYDYPFEKIWNTNGISLSKRLKTEPELKAKLDKVLTAKNLKKYIVKVNSAAPTRCIDGRPTLGWEKFDAKKRSYLGPKIAGGTAHAALAHRIVDVANIRDDLLFEHDINRIVKRYKEIEVGFGGHADNHQHGWNTGCGAVDNINLILERLQRPETQEQLRGLAKIVLGETYDGSHIVNEVIGRMLFLDALKPSYMPQDGNRPDGEFLYKKVVIDLLRSQAAKDSEPVPKLAGNHNEVAIILNFVIGTTIDTDRFSFDNDNQIQVFGWDIWEMYKEAARLYQYKMRDPTAKQQEAVLKRVKHITTRALLGISTAMVLTDGSLKVIAVTP